MRHHYLGIYDQLGGLYAEWEKWAAEVSESHTTYPILLYFRSPDPWLSWVVGLLTVMDAAAVQVAVAPQSFPSEARLLLHTGFTTFQQLASSMGWPVDPNPASDAPIELTFEEFAHAVAILVQYGAPVERSAEEAWSSFRGWRVNYEASAYRLADYLTAPPAHWTGTRRRVRAEAMDAHRPPHQLLDRDTGGLTPGPHVVR